MNLATSKVKLFVTIVNGSQVLTIVRKSSFFDDSEFQICLYNFLFVKVKIKYSG